MVYSFILKIILLIWSVIYIFIYDPYSNLENRKKKNQLSNEYNAYNTVLLKLSRIFHTIVGVVSINISLLLNIISTKGISLDNPKFNSKYGRGKYGKFDGRYAFCLYEPTGGSLMQYAVTNMFFWSFPRSDSEKYNKYIKNNKKTTINKIIVHPRTPFGHLFKKIINLSDPHFTIERISDPKSKLSYRTYKVRLIMFGKYIDENVLCDVWQILEPSEKKSKETVKLFLSRKLRDFNISKLGVPVSKGVGQGKICFININSYNNLKDPDFLQVFKEKDKC